MEAFSKGLALLFGAIVVGLVVSNPRGVEAVLNGLASFSSQTVRAFTEFRA
jgi:hypothetical protein